MGHGGRVVAVRVVRQPGRHHLRGAPEVYPNTATLSFHGSTYTSSTLSFTGYETTTNQRQGDGYKPLDTIPPADQALVTKYDNPPFVSQDSAGSIPFVNIGGKYVISGASYDPQVLQGKTHEQIARRCRIRRPTSARPSSARPT